MSVSEIKGELRKLGIRPSKKMGQHFLAETKIADWMVKRAEIQNGERILEIGPGLGVLTERLASYENELVIIEKDNRFCEYLGKRLGLKIINADALRIDLPPFEKVISNLPYQISSPLTMKLLEQDFLKGVLMYQKEFAEHLVAHPGTRAYSRLSVMVRYKADCMIVKAVPKGNFYPMPKVDSAVVEISPRPADFDVESEELFQTVVRILFSHKNRKVRNGLVSEHKQLRMEKAEAKKLADTLPHADERPVKLSPAEIARIANALSMDKTD